MFILWHGVWCSLFLTVLLVDKMKHRLCCPRTWVTVRPWAAFSIMFVDLVICAFLNPSVSRFMTFVYAILVRAQFTQTLILVIMSMSAMFAAGLVGTHKFLNSVSVAEFIILNFVCILASRQTEIHARLSLYRLWYIMTTGNKTASAFHGSVDEANLARYLLSTEELKLTTIHEDEVLAVDDMEAGLGLEINESEVRAVIVEAQSDHGSIPSRDTHQTPKEPRSPGLKTPDGIAGVLRRALSGDNPFPKPRTFSGEIHQACSEEASERHSIVSDFSTNPHNLPPWLALEGIDNFKRSVMGDQEDRNKWHEVHDVERYKLRGKSYVDDGKKIPAMSSAFSLHQARCFKTPKPVFHLASRLPSLRAFLQSHPKHFFFIYNRLVPYKNGTILSTVSLMVRKLPKGEDPVFDQLFDDFVCGTEEFRNLRLKHLSQMVQAPSVVTNAIWLMGGEKPVIIGKGYLDQRQFVGKNYIEIDVDVSPSRAAKMVVGKVIDQGIHVVMEEMLVLEGHSAEELPERPLCSWRWIRVLADSALIDLDEAILSPENPEDNCGVSAFHKGTAPQPTKGGRFVLKDPPSPRSKEPASPRNQDAEKEPVEPSEVIVVVPPPASCFTDDLTVLSEGKALPRSL